MFLIDSSAWIEYLRPKGSKKVKEKVREILRKDEVVCCGIVIVEVLRGAKNEKDFQSLIDSLMSLPQIPIDDTVIERASKWGFLLDRKGKIVPTTDLLIAAAAYKKARLLHVDSDFETISSLVDLEEEKISEINCQYGSEVKWRNCIRKAKASGREATTKVGASLSSRGKAL